MKQIITVCAAVLCGCAWFMGYTVNEADQARIAEEVVLAVTDKAAPLIEEATAEAEAAEEWEAEQEAAYYAPTYYAPTWYESDDADAEAEAKEWIAWRESGGDYDARNGQYIGRYQLSADKLDGDWSEENQEATAEQYVQERYGSWSAARDFWERNGWY